VLRFKFKQLFDDLIYLKMEMKSLLAT